MSIVVVEFATVKDRTRVASGEELQVKLETEWDPPSQGGTARVSFSCETSGYGVVPDGVAVTLPPDGESVTTQLRITLSGRGGEMVDVVATGDGGSCDSFSIMVTKGGQG
jgi:hypothetical protein